MKKSEITNQELLQAINQNIDQKLAIQKDDILTAVNQNIDQKLAIQKDDILTAVNQNIDQKLAIQKDDILTAVNQNIDQKLAIQKDGILTAVNQNIDQKLAIQKDGILVAMDQKLEDQKNEILDAILKTAELDEQRFQKIECSLGNVVVDLRDVKNKLGEVEVRLNGVEGTINTQMVTKDYLDRKFVEFGVEHNYKHKRVDKLTNILHKKKILNVAETQVVLAN